MAVGRGDYPQMTLAQVGEVLYFNHIVGLHPFASPMEFLGVHPPPLLGVVGSPKDSRHWLISPSNMVSLNPCPKLCCIQFGIILWSLIVPLRHQHSVFLKLQGDFSSLMLRYLVILSDCLSYCMHIYTVDSACYYTWNSIHHVSLHI